MDAIRTLADLVTVEAFKDILRRLMGRLPKREPGLMRKSRETARQFHDEDLLAHLLALRARRQVLEIAAR